MRMMNLDVFQKLLARHQEDTTESGTVTCSVLPVGENKLFFGREDVLQQLDEFLRPKEGEPGIRSVALWGLGGVGKTQTALAYAYSQRKTLGQSGRFGVVLWLPAETRLSLLQAFSKIAVEHLKLPRASYGADQENMLLVQTWLMQTETNWLLILDNVEDHQVLSEAWPVSNRGSVLVTTRKPAISSQPIDKDLELKEFPVDEGAEMLHHLLKNRKTSQSEDTAATEVSRLLNGHPLAINQMAAYINSRGMKIDAFLTSYKKHPQKLHRERRPGWKHVGYHHALDTVWALSFESLNKDSTDMLAVMSFLSSDSIPLELFQGQDPAQSASHRTFYQDDDTLWDSVEQLTDLALIRNSPETDSLSLHRLIQSEMRFRMTENERQGAFDTTVRLILSKFPDRGILAPRVDLWEKGAMYLEHILAIANDRHDSQQRTDPLKPTNDLCNLMTNVAYFIEDNDPVGMLSLCVNVASEAYKKLPEKFKDLNLWADILHTLAFRDLKEGDFKSCKMLGHEILSIYERQGRTDETTMTNVYNILGLATDSACQHDEARMWLEKSIEAQGDDDGKEDIRRLASRNHLNLARNRYSVDDFTEAEKQCDLSAAAAKTFARTWNVWAFIHETYASLYRRSGDLVKARHHVDMAWAALEEASGFATTSWTAGICAYRAAEVALAEGDAPRAIEWAERARTLNRMYRVPIGTLARSTHLLSRALRLDPGRAEEAEEVMKEADRLRELLPAGRTDLGDGSDEAFEMLVDIIQR